MKLIIAGGREVTFSQFQEAIKRLEDSGIVVTELVNGMCRKGVDYMAYLWAESKGIPIKPFPADWDAFGRAAGPIRNRQMAEYGDALYAIWNGKTPGTKNMIEEAQKAKIWMSIYRV